MIFWILPFFEPNRKGHRRKKNSSNACLCADRKHGSGFSPRFYSQLLALCSYSLEDFAVVRRYITSDSFGSIYSNLGPVFLTHSVMAGLLPIASPCVVSKDDLEELAGVLCQHLEAAMVPEFADFQLEMFKELCVYCQGLHQDCPVLLALFRQQAGEEVSWFNFLRLIAYLY